MKTVIDCTQIQTRAQLHDALQNALSLPDLYGRNLDALADCLGDIRGDTQLVLQQFGVLKDRLGFYAHTLEIVLRRACEDNDHLTVTYTELDT